MKINKITKLKNGLYQIEVDKDTGVEKFKITEEVMIEHHLYSNKQLSDEEYKMLYSLVHYSKLYTQALNYIAYKMRTEKEVHDYLIKKEVDQQSILKIIEKLKRLNYVNDTLYTELFMKQSTEINKKGPNWIKNELIKKGIPLSLINQNLQQISTANMIQNIDDYIRYFDKGNKKKSINKLKESIFKSLLTKGYDLDLIKSQLEHYDFYNSEHHVDETTLLNKEMEKAYNKLKKRYSDYELKSKLIRTLLNKGFSYDEILSSYQQYELEE